MANFKQYPGRGRWDGSNNCLTVPKDEPCALILWGGGPDGKPLVVALSQPHLVLNVHSQSGPGAHEQTILFTPKAIGTITFHARAGSGSGPDYVAPFRVVIVPAKPSPIGPEHVIFYSESPSGRDKSEVAIEGDKKAVAVGGSAYRIQSNREMYDLLVRYRDSGRNIGRLEFNTHGGPGVVRLCSGEALTTEGLGYFKGKGFDSVFSPQARVFFQGCNIAEGEKGEEFLKEFGKTATTGPLRRLKGTDRPRPTRASKKASSACLFHRPPSSSSSSSTPHPSSSSSSPASARTR